MAIKKRKQQAPRPQVEPGVQQRLREVATELRHMLYGETGCPEWGTLFREIEQDGMTVGLELARLLYRLRRYMRCLSFQVNVIEVVRGRRRPTGKSRHDPGRSKDGMVSCEVDCGRTANRQ